ncbi:hypothetical protein B5F40_08840 [Gordonibacter sp. An230]|nr:hypothetical protein B5F40_08840 [Gordonibacter sp. An230]
MHRRHEPPQNLVEVEIDVVGSTFIAGTPRYGDFAPSRLANERLFSLRQATRLGQSTTESGST